MGTNQPYDLSCDWRSFLGPTCACTDISFVRHCTESDSRTSLSKIDSLWRIGLNRGSLSSRRSVIAVSRSRQSLPHDNLCRFVSPTWKVGQFLESNFRLSSIQGLHEIVTYRAITRKIVWNNQCLVWAWGSLETHMSTLTASHSAPYSAACGEA